MNEKKAKRQYVPPRIENLLGSSAQGGQTEGICGVGYYPYAECGAGADVAGAGCGNGGSPSGYQCRPFGTAADSNCGGGGYQ
jgi:hypothetical protein